MTRDPWIKLQEALYLSPDGERARLRLRGSAGEPIDRTYQPPNALERAKDDLKRIREAKAAGAPTPVLEREGRGSVTTLGAFADQWLQKRVAVAQSGRRTEGGRKKNVVLLQTLRGTERLLRCHVVPHLGHVQLSKTYRSGPTKTMIEEWLVDLAQRGYAQSTVGELLNLVGRLLNDALLDGYLVMPPVVRAVQPFAPAKPRRGTGRCHEHPYGCDGAQHPLTIGEMATILRALPSHVAAGGVLGAMCGCRTGEVLGLRCGDLELWQESHGHVGWLVLKRQRNMKGPKGSPLQHVPWLKHRLPGAVRRVPLSPSAVAYFKAYLRHYHPDAYRALDAGDHDHPAVQRYLVVGTERCPGGAADDAGYCPGHHYVGVGAHCSGGERIAIPLDTLVGEIKRAAALLESPPVYEVTPQSLREAYSANLKALVPPTVRSDVLGHRGGGQSAGGSPTTDTNYSGVLPATLVPVASAVEELWRAELRPSPLVPDNRLSTYEAGLRLGISPKNVAVHCRQGTLKAVLVEMPGHPVWRIDPGSVDDMLTRRAEVVGGPVALVGLGDLTFGEVAKHLGVPRTFVRSALRAGKVPSARKKLMPPTGKLGNRLLWMFDAAAVAEVAAATRPAVDPADLAATA